MQRSWQQLGSERQIFKERQPNPIPRRLNQEAGKGISLSLHRLDLSRYRISIRLENVGKNKAEVVHLLSEKGTAN